MSLNSQVRAILSLSLVCALPIYTQLKLRNPSESVLMCFADAAFNTEAQTRALKTRGRSYSQK